MLENNKINYFSNKFKISIDTLFEVYKNDKKSLFLIFKKIYHLHTGLKLYRPRLEYLLLFNPLPKYFKISDYSGDFLNICSRYSFHGEKSNNILMGNVILPHQSISPIPFFFQYKFKNKNYYKISNVFYYEITIDKEPFREPWDGQSISIGYGTTDTPIKNNHVGWSPNSIGYHCDDGKVFSDNSILCELEKYSYGDTVGCVLIYLNKNEYKVLYTLNGKLLPFSRNFITKKQLTTMISLDYPAAVTTNFGENNFLFNIEEFILPNLISTKNYFIYNYFRLNGHTFDSNLGMFNLVPKKLIIKKKTPFNNYNTIQNMMFKNELLEPLISNDQNELNNFLESEETKENFEEIHIISNNIINSIKKDILYLSNVTKL